MSFRAMKFRFLADFSFVSWYFVKATCTRFNSFLHTVSQPLEKHLAIKPHDNRRDFFLCFVVVLQFNCEQRLLFTVKRNRSVFIHDLERVNELSRLNSHVKFSSNKVDVACCLHLSRKILKRDRNCHLYIINK